MIGSRRLRLIIALVLGITLIAGIGIAARPWWRSVHTTRMVAYFDNSTGIYPGDSVLILGVRVGKIERIDPEPQRARITFTVDRKYPIPSDVRAVIISPTLVTSRAIQLTPVYNGGPVLGDDAVIPQNRTAVPVEYDDLREQLQKLSKSLEPTAPGQPSPMGAFINTAADNLRGEGDQIRDAIIHLSQAVSAFGDHSDDVFTNVRDLSTLVSGLQSSTTLMRELNTNFAAVTSVLANDPDEVGRAVADIDAVAADIQHFVAENKEPLGLATDKLSSLTTTLVDNRDEIKQLLHVAPNALGNLNSIYTPATGAISGALAFNQFANPVSFLCGAIQAASRLGAEQSAKLCVQYLAPIMKNRQFNFPPIGTSIGLGLPFPIVGAMARPNEVTYSEDWMRPDYRPSPPQTASPQTASPQAVTPAPLLAAEAPAPQAISTDPAAGLPGMMIPHGGGQ